MSTVEALQYLYDISQRSLMSASDHEKAGKAIEVLGKMVKQLEKPRE